MDPRYMDLVGHIPGAGVMLAAIPEVIPGAQEPTALVLMAWLVWSIAKYALDKKAGAPVTTKDQELELLRQFAAKHAVHDRVCEDTLACVRASQRIQEETLTEIKALHSHLEHRNG